jgi:hypothetical protein
MKHALYVSALICGRGTASFLQESFARDDD